MDTDKYYNSVKKYAHSQLIPSVTLSIRTQTPNLYEIRNAQLIERKRSAEGLLDLRKTDTWTANWRGKRLITRPTI